MTFDTSFSSTYRALPPIIQLLAPLVTLLVLKLLVSTGYNILLHPLRHVPGPRWAAMRYLLPFFLLFSKKKMAKLRNPIQTNIPTHNSNFMLLVPCGWLGKDHDFV